MISLYERLRKNKVVVIDMETTGLVCGEEGRESDRILEIAAIRPEHLRPAETFHTYVANPQPLSEEVAALTGISDEMLAGAPPVQEALQNFAAFAQGAILVGYNLAFGCKFLDFYGAQCGVIFPADRVDLLPIAKRLLGRSVESYNLQTVWKEFLPGKAGTGKELETCMQQAEAAADLAYLLSYVQRKRHNDTPMYRIVAQRRKNVTRFSLRRSRLHTICCGVRCSGKIIRSSRSGCISAPKNSNTSAVLWTKKTKNCRSGTMK